MENILGLSQTVEALQKDIRRLRAKAMKQYGLGVTDMACINVLREAPKGLTSTELSRVCNVDKALISRSVKKLLEAGMINYVKPRIPLTDRKNDPGESGGKERRGAYRVPLQLTAYGKEVLSDLYRITGEAVKAATKTLSEKQISDLLDMLVAIRIGLGAFLEDAAADV